MKIPCLSDFGANGVFLPMEGMRMSAKLDLSLRFSYCAISYRSSRNSLPFKAQRLRHIAVNWE
jgi:hypothetical protein